MRKKKRKTRKEKIEALRAELSKLITGGKSEHDKYLRNGECYYPGCKCNKRPVFSRHRIKAAI